MAEEMEEQHVFGQKSSYEKHSLLERRELALKVKECKAEYIAELVYERKDSLGSKKETSRSGYA